MAEIVCRSNTQTQNT